MSFFSFTKKSNLTIIFDVRDSLISLAAVKIEKDKKLEIILAQNFPINLTAPKNYELSRNQMIKALDNAMISFRKNLIRIGNQDKISEYHFFLSSFWATSQSRLLKISKDRSFEINKELLEQILSKEESDIAYGLDKNQNWIEFERKIVETKINGYKIQKIFGKKAQDFEVEFFVSFLPQQLKNLLYSFTNRKLKDSNIHSGTLPIYSFLRDLYEDKNDFIFLDVGDYITDVFVVKNDTMEGIASIPLGKKEMMEKSAKNANATTDIILSALHMGGDDKNKKYFESIAANLLSQVDTALSQITTEIDVPKNIFMMNRDFVETFKNIIMENNLKMLYDSKIMAIEENIINTFSGGKAFKNAQYAKIDAIFLNKFLKNKND
jgi:hypothetical protein